MRLRGNALNNLCWWIPIAIVHLTRFSPASRLPRVADSGVSPPVGAGMAFKLYFGPFFGHTSQYFIIFRISINSSELFHWSSFYWLRWDSDVSLLVVFLVIVEILFDNSSFYRKKDIFLAVSSWFFKLFDGNLRYISSVCAYGTGKKLCIKCSPYFSRHGKEGIGMSHCHRHMWSYTAIVYFLYLIRPSCHAMCLSWLPKQSKCCGVFQPPSKNLSHIWKRCRKCNKNRSWMMFCLRYAGGTSKWQGQGWTAWSEVGGGMG